MASFETDLARYLADYDEAERLSEVEQSMVEENSDYAVNGEAATVIPGDMVADPDVPAVRVTDVPGGTSYSYVAPMYGDPWGRD